MMPEPTYLKKKRNNGALANEGYITVSNCMLLYYNFVPVLGIQFEVHPRMHDGVNRNYLVEGLPCLVDFGLDR